jgi:hypothetical protein
MPPSDKVPEPWRSLLADIDSQSPQPIQMHCIGGFAVTIHYGLVRPTGDIDVWHVIPTSSTIYDSSCSTPTIWR